jgi:hypothetical protein
LVFVHIPKCAGTSIEVAAGFGRQYPSLGLQPTAIEEDRAKLFGGGLEHVSIREILTTYRDLFDEKPRSFTIVRDTVDRFVSHFVWRFYRFNENHPPLVQALEELRRFATQTAAAAAHSAAFKNPFGGLLYTGAPDSLHPNDLFRHLVPQTAFVFDSGQCAVDDIYHMDELDYVAEWLHTAYAFPNVLPKRMVGTFSSDLRAFVPADLETLIRSMYEADEHLLRTVERERTIRG